MSYIFFDDAFTPNRPKKMTRTPKHPIRALLTAPLLLIAATVFVACGESPAADDPDDVTVFTVTLDFETGTLDYDENAFDGYAGGPVIIRGVDGEGNTFSEDRGEDLNAAFQSLMSSAAASFTEEPTTEDTIRRAP